MKYFDAHSHIHDREFDADREEVLARMEKEETGAILVGTHRKSSEAALALAKAKPYLFATVGIHPTDTKEKFDKSVFLKLAKDEKVVGIGECGLDYFRGADMAEKERQKNLFKEQIKLAIEVDKPLMVHGRPSKGTMDAYEDIIKIFSEYKKEKIKANIHFFQGNIAVAKKFTELGFTMSFSGVITFAREYDETIRQIPEELILIETDAPYASPVPYRGKRNEPIYVLETLRRLAKVREVDETALGLKVLDNAVRAFNLSL